MTIAKQFNITEFALEIWNKTGFIIYYENTDGFWVKRKFDSKGNNIYYENSTGYWVKSEWDSKGNEIYFENSDGDIVDYR